MTYRTRSGRATLGDREATGTLLKIQPVMPFGISKSTNVILRVIMLLTFQPGPAGPRINGLGDIVATVFFSPVKSGRIIGAWVRSSYCLRR